jgi:hypothetical protein
LYSLSGWDLSIPPPNHTCRTETPVNPGVFHINGDWLTHG